MAVGGERTVIDDAYWPGPEHSVVLVSADGDIWEPATPPGAMWLSSVAYGHGLFVAVGDGVFVSQDGRDWRDPSDDVRGSFAEVAYGNGVFVVLTSDGSTHTSTDGEQWSSSGSPVIERGAGVVFGAGAFVAWSGAGDLAVSTNGLSWDPVEIAGVNPDELLEVRAVSVIDGAFVGIVNQDPWFVAGVAPTSEVIRNYVEITSRDGRAWTVSGPRMPPILSESQSGDGYVGLDCERFTLHHSADGSAWSSALGEAYAVVQSGGRFVAVGRDHVLSSRDGRVWEPVFVHDPTSLSPPRAQR
ncbi:hypothetical protein [Haliangium sp.]|uniref:hypothetical protein n=1 Tax=Haliangium sp. TaxID=2663208 RepID=UPI003D1230C7